MVRDHGGDDGVEILGLVLRAGDFGVDLSGEPVFRKLVPFLDVEDRAVADRPDVLDAVDAGIGRTDGVPAVRGHAKAEAMRLLDCDLDQVHRQKFVELDDVVAERFLAVDRGARFVGRRHHDVAAELAGVRRIGLRASAADSAPRRPDARAANLSRIGAVALRQRPRPILIDLDGRAGGDAEMQIKLAEKIFPMAMAVEKARQHGLAAGVDDLRALRNGHLAVAAGGGEAAVLDDDDGILDRRPPGAVDQRAADDGENGCGLRAGEAAQRQ